MKRSLQLAAIATALLAAGRAEAQTTPTPRERFDRSRAVVEIPASTGWVGFTFSTGAKGEAVVSDVFEDSPADRAGIEEGDTIVLWNGSSEVGRAIRRSRLDAGDTVRVRIRRRGERDRDLTLRAAGRPRGALALGGGVRHLGDNTIVITIPDHEIRALTDSLVVRIDSLHQHLRVLLADSLGKQLQALREIEMPRVRVELDGLQRDLGPGGVLFGLGSAGRTLAGAEFSPMNPGLATYFGTDEGLLAVRVADGTPAARSGLRAGDVVVEANDAAVRDIADLRRAIQRGSNRAGRAVKLDIIRKGKRQELKLQW